MPRNPLLTKRITGLDLRENAGLKRYGSPMFSTARLLPWPDCMALFLNIV